MPTSYENCSSVGVRTNSPKATHIIVFMIVVTWGLNLEYEGQFTDVQQIILIDERMLNLWTYSYN